MFKSSKLISFLYPLLILCMFSTLVGYWMPMKDKMPYIVMAFAVAIVFFDARFFASKSFGWFAAYAAIVCLNFAFGKKYFIDRYSFNSLLNLASVFVIMMGLAHYSLVEKNRGEHTLYRNTFIVIFLIISIATICTAILNVANPGILRSYMHAEEDYVNVYFRFGLSNYSLPHAVPIIIPAIVCAIRNTQSKPAFKFCMWILLALCFYLIILSGATTPLLLAALVLIMSFTVNKGGRKKNRYIGWIVILIPFILFPEILNSVLGFFVDVFSSNETTEDFSTHLQDIISSNEAGESTGDVAARSELYWQTIIEFIKSPIWGSNGNLGGHSAILDRAAALGIIGIIPLYFMIKSQYQMFSSTLDMGYFAYYKLGVLAAVLMLLSKNMFNTELFLMLFVGLPFMLLYQQESVAPNNNARTSN